MHHTQKKGAKIVLGLSSMSKIKTSVRVAPVFPALII